MQENSMKREDRVMPPFVMVLFGGTGDLAKRKLFPALFALFKQGYLGEQFAVVGSGRREKSVESFRADIRQAIDSFSRLRVDDEREWDAFAAHFAYCPCTVTETDSYEELKNILPKLDEQFGTEGNRIFYLAMAPEYFGPIAMNLKSTGLTSAIGWNRVIIEKPFGHDLASAILLNEQIQGAFKEEEIYRIDHYLGKEMVQNIEVIRFANSLFEPLWNNRYIDNVQITLSEKVGVEDRGGYYDGAGALRDMVQNHILQMVMMVAMEPPSRLNTDAVRDEKVKVLRSLRPLTQELVRSNFVRGQYIKGTIGGQRVPGYREEEKVNPASQTETFVAAELFVDNFRWAGVPFYVRTGKRMPHKATEIVIQFKEVPKNLYYNQSGNLGPNLLIIRVNPVEGMYMMLNAKKPGSDGRIVPVAMEFCNNCDIQSPEAYERLLFDAIHGDSTYFTRWDESATAWTFVEPILQEWTNDDTSPLAAYEAGSWGPVEAAQLLSREGRHWWSIYGDTGQNVVVAVEQTTTG